MLRPQFEPLNLKYRQTKPLNWEPEKKESILGVPLVHEPGSVRPFSTAR